MKIEGTCDTCDRTFLLSQIGAGSDAPGRCPFCGARFARHYRGMLVETVESAERSAEELMTALARLHGLETGFHINSAGVMTAIERHLNDQDPSPAGR